MNRLFRTRYGRLVTSVVTAVTLAVLAAVAADAYQDGRRGPVEQPSGPVPTADATTDSPTHDVAGGCSGPGAGECPSSVVDDPPSGGAGFGDDDPCHIPGAAGGCPGDDTERPPADNPTPDDPRPDEPDPCTLPGVRGGCRNENSAEPPPDPTPENDCAVPTMRTGCGVNDIHPDTDDTTFDDAGGAETYSGTETDAVVEGSP